MSTHILEAPKTLPRICAHKHRLDDKHLITYLVGL